MNKGQFVACALSSAAMLLLTGCVAVRKVDHKDAPRTDVQFESLGAARTFYDGILWQKFPASGKHSKILLGQTAFRRETRPTANFVFNAAVAAADLNGDRRISESEAQAFSLAGP